MCFDVDAGLCFKVVAFEEALEGLLEGVGGEKEFQLLQEVARRAKRSSKKYCGFQPHLLFFTPDRRVGVGRRGGELHANELCREGVG